MFKYLYQLKEYYKYLFLKKENKKIIIYSEGDSDWHFFEKIIEILIFKHNLKICYVTSDQNEKKHFLENKNFNQFYIGSGFFLIIFFQFLKSKMCLMTMGDFGNYHLKKNINSLNPTKYIYLPHTPVSAHMVDNKNYYKNFDVVLCTGPQFYDEQKKMEEVYNHPKKQLLKIGYPNFERMFDVKKTIKIETQENYNNKSTSCVLAPSWGDNMIIEKYGYEIVSRLVENNIKVFFRPHPRSVQLSFNKIKKIIDSFGNSNYFVYNPKISSVIDMCNSDLMISDWSGVAIEYSVVFKKPVLFIDTFPKIKNKDYEQLEIEPLEKKIRNQIGKILSPNNLENIHECVYSLKKLNNEKSYDYDYVYKKNYYNPYESTQKCANEINNLYMLND